MRTVDEIKLRAAYHEGGHIVAARLTGTPVLRASLKSITTRYRRNDTTAVRKEAVIAASGPAAEVKFLSMTRDASKPLWNTVWFRDAEKIVQVTDRRAVVREARELVDRHWGHVGVVARALMDRGSLSGAEIDTLIFLHNGGRLPPR
jgi:hypothetical protein